MNFPLEYCIETKHLTQETYQWLLTKLIGEGYHWPSVYDKSEFFGLWNYFGVNSYGDIMLYSYKEYYLDYPEDPFWNVLTKEWLEDYLNGE